LGVYTADPLTIVDHYLQLGTSSCLIKSRCSFMQLIWFASTWIIWKEMNAKISCTKESTPYQLFKNIKLLIIWWFKTLVSHYKIHDRC